MQKLDEVEKSMQPLHRLKKEMKSMVSGHYANIEQGMLLVAAAG
ncbi:MAG: hypothetical protein ACLR5S_01245 [Ruminococcus sp.]